MAKKSVKWEKFYNRLSIVFHGTIAFSMIPFGWAFLETQKKFTEVPVPNEGFGSWFNILLCLGILVIIVLAIRLNRRLVAGMKQLPDLQGKLSAYSNQKFRYFALLEVAALIAFAGLYSTHFQAYSALYVVVLFIFSLGRPTFDRVVNELGINREEMEKWMEE